MNNNLAFVLPFIVLTLHVGTADADVCTAKKLKAVAKKEAGLLSCRSRAVKKGDASLIAPCVAKVENRYANLFAKAGACAGDQGICGCLADVCANAVREQLPEAGPSKCESARLKAAGKKASAKLRCNAKAESKDQPVDAACIQKAETKFLNAFAKTSGCTGDATSVETAVDEECVSAVGADPTGGATVGAICPACTPPSTTSTTTTSTTMSTVTTTSVTTTTMPEACPAPVVPPLQVIAVNATAVGFAPYAIQPPGSTDWYIVEQAGRIKIIRGGIVQPTNFLDVTAGMGTGLNERGLLSVAFHPSYATNGRFFTMGTPSDNGNGTYAPANSDAVVEWARSATNADVAVGTKVQDIVVLPASDQNHNGGTIKFGPDNYLYFATGDGGGGCESSKPGQVQDITKLFGKVLRLDIDGTAPFAAPGNPFASDARVYHYGLRNPFRFNFDPITSDFYVGDVGQSSYEEVSLSPGNAPAKNFGWPAFEGDTAGTCSGSHPLGGPSPHTPPIRAMDRTPGSTDPFSDYASVIGGAVYRGSAIPQLQGVYLFADFYGSSLGAIRHCGGGEVSEAVAVPLSQIPASHGTFTTISSFVQGNDGELYVTYGGSTRIGRFALQ